jgi:hypothetical protein
MAVSHHPMRTNQTARTRKPGPYRGAMTICGAWALTLTGAVGCGTTAGSGITVPNQPELAKLEEFEHCAFIGSVQ